MCNRVDLLRDQWSVELFSFRKTLDQYTMPLPDTCVYEFTHALMHILAGYRYTLSARPECLKSACAHIRRAHLDYLKIYISHIHSQLQKNSPNSHLLNFIKAKISARLKEFGAIGSSHEETINDFRSIIDNYKPSGFSFSVPPEFKILDPRIKEDEEPRVASMENARHLRDMSDLIDQWARLESITTSIHGKKLYHVSYDLVDTYIKFENMRKDLMEQIVGFKFGIIEMSNKLDYNGVLQKKLNDCNAYVAFITPAKTGLNSSDQQVQEEAFQTIAQYIDEPFSIVKDFLDLPLNLYQMRTP